MSSTPLPTLPGGKLFEYFTPDYIRGLLALYGDLKELLRRDRGVYEILDYDAAFTIFDAQGKRAVLNKQQKVRFLQENVIAFQDYAWGDGAHFKRYRCTPGTVVDRYREGDRFNILVSLRETKAKGDVETFYIEHHMLDAFTAGEEWCQVEIRHRTKHLKLSVTFPKDRHCVSAQILERSQHKATSLGLEQFAILPDGRQVVTWEAHNIKTFEIFTLKWRW